MAANPYKYIAEDEEPPELQETDGIEPEIGLMLWAEQLGNIVCASSIGWWQWEAEKNNREERIQQIYNQLEMLWSRLEVDQDSIDMFIEINRGTGEATIQAVRW
jgi:Ase1/PRC1/MAP65 family protein